MKQPTNKQFKKIVDKELNPISNKINKLHEELSKSININKITNSFIDTAENIYEYISLYYTYYKLNLYGVKDFEYEYRMLENKLYNDLYYMNLFLIIDKMSIFTYKFKFYHTENEEFFTINDIYNKDEVLNLLPILKQCSNVDYEFIMNLISLGNKFTKLDLDYSYSKEDIILLCKYVEENYKWFSEPNIFLAKANNIFKSGQQYKLKEIQEKGIIIEGTYLCYGYDDSFVYSSIFEYLALRNNPDYSKTLLVDAGFSEFHYDLSMIQKIFFDIITNSNKNIEYAKITHSQGKGDYIVLFEDIKENKNYNRIYEIAKIANPRLQSFKYRTIILDN